jgi:hypothetical protein
MIGREAARTQEALAVPKTKIEGLTPLNPAPTRFR